MFPPNVVTHVKFKPLLPLQELGAKFRAEKILKSLRRQIGKEIRQRIMQEPMSQDAKAALLKGFRVTVGARSITLEATHPAFRPLLQGQKRQQMTWLTKARVPIPIVLDTGEVIFRSATPRSMQNGSWYHPGRQPTRVIDQAREAARDVIKKRLRKEFKKQLQQMMR